MKTAKPNWLLAHRSASSRRFRNFAAFLTFTCATLLPCAKTQAATVAPAPSVALSADDAANAVAPVWTTLDAITLAENANDDFSAGANATLVLKAPAGFQFATSSPPTVAFGDNGDIAAASVVVGDASTLTITLTVTNTTHLDSLTLSGLQVRPLQGTPLATGGHLYRPAIDGGSAILAGITTDTDGSGGTSFGALAELPGVAVELAFTTQPDGAVVNAPFTTQPVVKAVDQFGNPSTNGLPASLNVTLTAPAIFGAFTVDLGAAGGSGTATFANVGIAKAGPTNQLTASAPGLTNATSAVFSVMPALDGTLFADDFSRTNNAGDPAPWIAEEGSLVVADGQLQASGSVMYSYAIGYLPGSWTNYSVQAQIQFSEDDGYGGGIDGRLDANTGARYAAWVYPENSPAAIGYGSAILQLVKFHDWNNWSFVPMAVVPLGSVGTASHTLKMAFKDNQVGLFFDGVLITNVDDNSFDGIPPFASGGIAVDMWNDADNYTLSFDNVTATVSQLPLTVTAMNQARVYGAANPELTGSIAGLQAGDNITATFMTAPDSNSAVGDYPINFTLSDPDHKLGYYQVTTNNALLTVTPAPLSVTASNASRIYGEANPAFTGQVVGVVNDDDITATYNTAASITSPVGDYTILPTLVDPAGRLANYTVSSSNGTLTVTAAPLSVIADDASRLYGDMNPSFSGSISGVVNGDDITAAYNTAATTGSPVGPYAIVPTLIDPDGKLGNYAVSSTDGTLTVTAATLSVTANNASRVYGETNPVFTGALVGLLNGDSITATFTSMAETNSPVGTYAITSSLLDPESKLGNYTVGSTNGTLTILPAPLSVIASNASRLYGTTNPVFSGTIEGLVNNDNISATYDTTATLASPVGQYDIAPTLVDPQGKLGNYSINSTNGVLNVTSAALIVVANDASRTYGATNPVFDGTITGLENGDNITATYASAAETNSPIGVYSITSTLVDPDGKLTNYTVFSTNGSLTVMPAILSITASNASRVYGSANPLFSGVINGLVNEDNITATYASAATAASPVGTYDITPALVDPDGKLTNYTVFATNGVLNVTAAALIIVANDATRAYGATNPVFNGTITGLENGDNITATYASAAETNSPIGAYSITPSLVDPDGRLTNYTVFSTNGTLTVTPAQLIVTADNASRAYGAENPGFTGSLAGLLNGDNISATFSTAAETNSPVGTYAITSSLLDPESKLGNYNVSATNGTLTVTAAPLSVTADDATRVEGEANPVFTGTLTGLMNGDNITTAYSTTATPSSPAGTYPIVPSLADPDGRLMNYSVSITNGTLTVTPAAPPVILSVQALNGTNVVLTWTALSNRTYSVQYKTDLSGIGWTDLSTNVMATNSTATFTDHPGAETQRFYRVGLLP